LSDTIVTTTPQGAQAAPWYADWQHPRHAAAFDRRSTLTRARLIRHYEAFNDVRLLNERLDRLRPLSLVEIGCATAEFYRYLRERHPQVRYFGVDVSQAAIARATAKYPEAKVVACRPDEALPEVFQRTLGLGGTPEIVYAKDVVHHQTDPLGFVSRLLRAASEAVIVRTRTRDVGATVTDPEQSCQYHYDGWMPYIVSNLQELIDAIRQQVPTSEVIVRRHHMVLGGRENRLLPKDCYLPSTGTAETAIAILLKTPRPGHVTVEDRRESLEGSSWRHRLTRWVPR
jgi:SAM-dependent methyltransferase